MFVSKCTYCECRHQKVTVCECFFPLTPQCTGTSVVFFFSLSLSLCPNQERLCLQPGKIWFTSCLSQGAQCLTFCPLLPSLVYLLHSPHTSWPLSPLCRLHSQHDFICLNLPPPSLPPPSIHPIPSARPARGLMVCLCPPSPSTDSPREWHQPRWAAGLPGVLPVPAGSREEAVAHVSQSGPQQRWCGPTEHPQTQGNRRKHSLSVAATWILNVTFILTEKHTAVYVTADTSCSVS